MSAAARPPVAAEFDLAATPLADGTSLIEASAGTGKTFTLAGLYLRLLIERRLGVEQILVVTYTKAATGELRERIRRLLTQAQEAFARLAANQPPAADLPAYLVRLLRQHSADTAAVARKLDAALGDFDQAAIYTIHGFCQRALRDRAFETASLFDVELLPDPADLEARAMEDFWRREVVGAGAVAVAFAMVELETPAALLRDLRALLQHPRLAMLPDPPLDPQTEQREIASALARLQAEWAAQAGQIKAVFGSQAKWCKDLYILDAKMQAAFAGVEAVLMQSNPSPAALSRLRLFTCAAIAKGTRSQQSPPDLPFFSLCDAFFAAADRWLIAVRQAALRALRETLPSLKAQLKVQTYDDLLARLDAALRSPTGEALAAALRAQFHAALIDEFQDTDPLQFEIFRRIFQSPTADGRRPVLFLIGDPKQAIYRFRGADLHTYLLAKRTADRRFTLRQNFRSETPLVEAVNTIFSRNPAAFLAPDIPFEPARSAADADHAPFTLAGRRPPALQVWLYPASQGSIPAETARRTLPPIIASEIVRLLNSGARLGDRPLAPRDLAILVPANADAPGLAQALVARGVHAVLQTTASLFVSEAVTDMRRLLAALAAPGDEARLKSAICTVALGLDAAQLQAAAQDEAEWQTRCERFAELAQVWDRAGFLPTFRALLQREQVRPRLLALDDGERRLTNLLHLAEILHDAAREHQLSRAGLLHWLDEQAEAKTGGEVYQLRLERDEHAVRIATIHRSKGLQYGVVFCPYSWKGVLGGQRKPQPMFHRQDAAGRPELVFDFGSDELEDSRTRAAEEELAEDIRKYYVALTRAEHRCVVVWGRFNQAETSAAAWLLHPPPGDAPPLEALKANWTRSAAPRIAHDLDQFAADSGNTLEVVPLPSANEARYQPPVAEVRPAAARRFTGAIERDWRISSFSSLTAGRHSEQPDYDPHPAPPTDDTPATGIFAFPRGARAGVCLHELFEQLDFTRARAPEPRAIIARVLRESGLESRWLEVLERMVDRVLGAPLPTQPPVSLAEVPPAARLNELEFCFPIGRLDPTALSDFLARHSRRDEPPGRLVFEPVTGLVKGFMDLVFKARGRFFLVDWKSNWLGNQPRDYAPARLAEEIRRRHYDLQYRLYTVALDKYLRARVPDYDYDRHFGGVCYIFLRGVHESHPECGIHFDRPSADFLREFRVVLEA